MRHTHRWKKPSPGPRSSTLAWTFPLVLVLLGCGSEQVPDNPLGTPPPPSTRPSDGILQRPVLQEVVDLQVRRDGEAIRSFLLSDDPQVRARAAFALASVQDPGAASDLTPLLRDPVAAVRRDAAFALGQLGDPLYGPVLLGALREEEDPQVRERLFEAVGKVGEERVVEGLLTVDLSVGEGADLNLALARAGVRGFLPFSGIQHLVDGLRDPDPEARVNAAYYFGRSSTPGDWAGQAGSVRGVLDSLHVSEPEAMHLVLGLSLLSDPQDIPRFLWWLENSPDWRIRANAARGSMGQAAHPAVRLALFRALEEPTTHVASYAADGLAGIRQLAPRDVDNLKEWVEDHPDEWRRAGSILAVLARMGEGEFLRDWLDRWSEDDILPRTRGLGAMAFVPGDEATRILTEAAASTQPRIRGTALGGLARRWRVEKADPEKHTVYFQAFSAGLRTGDPSALFVAAPALADSFFLPLGSAELLMEEYGKLTLPDGLEGMQAILRALGETGTQESEAFLMQELQRSTGALRESAGRALAALQGEEFTPSRGVGEAEREIDWTALGQLGARPRLHLETEKGTVTLVMDTESAPLTVQTILAFAQEGLFDGVPFHRVVPNFVIQGGDFARKDGYGGPGFSIRSEFTQLLFGRGVVGMASAGKDTEGSQFFITHSMQPHLDGGYTAFGWVEEGMDVVDRIYESDRILTARVEPDRS